MTRLAPIALMLLTTPVFAQETGAVNRDAMKKLDFLVGKWRGDATVMTPGMDPKPIKQTEDVQFKLNGVVLLIEGIGRGKLPGKDEEGVVFNALAVMSYDPEAKKYKVKAYRAEGQSVDADMTVSERGLVWGFKEPKRGVEVRYTLTLTPKDEWHEIGEFSLDGKTWTKFIEMTLTRVKE